MITITTEKGLTHVVKPTFFPDRTSQVWKLPAEMFEARDLEITWHFDEEREIIDLLSLRRLLVSQTWNLHIPFLPYARQDKNIDNTSTFNLVVLAELINSLGCQKVTAVDVHNPMWTAELIKNFENIEVTVLHELLIRENNVDYVVFPDLGAASRYNTGALNAAVIICDKVRDQATGNITGHQITSVQTPNRNGVPYNFLIIDDLCDGGATFISVARMLNDEYQGGVGELNLFVTHGVFSRGRQHLLNNGITKVFTTNSLTKNGEGFQV
jgi:ribose-phosphate pyrophosphokinase